MSIRRGGNIVAGSVNKKEIVDLIENETRVVVKVIEGVFENDSSFISLSADDLKIKSQIISVNLGNSVILPNTYSLSSDGKTLNFVEQIEQGTKYAISYTKKFDIVGEDYVTEAELNVKQDKLTAGKNITIENNIISSDCINDKITNCITEIPQDIKLELNNGTLTLKAGSKVYVPNGSGTYNAVTVASDIGSGSISGISEDYMFFLNPSGTGQAGGSVSNCYSGASAPSSPSTGWFWYDTTNNSVKRWSGSAWVGGFSLPFCIITSGASSIKQTFNGFGFIGSTAFALPGVKGLIPNGRNADGSLKSIELVSDRVWTRTWESNPNYKDLSLATTGIGINTNTYKEEENFVYNAAGNKVTDRFVFGKMEYSGSSPYNVTSLQPKTTFHAVDYNDKTEITSWSAPSDKKVDLTFGASGATYTAPANGWLCVYGIASQANGYIEVAGKLVTGGQNAAATGSIWVSTEAKKGDVITIRYANYTNQRFYFRYAEGEI